MNIFNVNVRNFGIVIAMSLFLALFSVSTVKAEGESAALSGIVPSTQEENDKQPAVVDANTVVIVEPVNGSGTTIVPAVEPVNGSGTTIVPPTEEENHTDLGIPTTPPVTPPAVITGGGGGSSSSGSRTVLLTPILTLASTTPGSCVYLNDYLKLDGSNNPAEVTKLQAFLKSVENLDVDVNGTFDAKTFNAVKAFQAKYMNDTMTPWGSSNPTGQVFYTTKKKVNEIFCNTNFPLTLEQLAQIEAYKNGVANGIANGTIQVDSNGNIIEVTSTSSTPNNPELGSNGDVGDSQTAAVGDVGFFGKIWNFIKWLFGY